MNNMENEGLISQKEISQKYKDEEADAEKKRGK